MSQAVSESLSELVSLVDPDLNVIFDESRVVINSKKWQYSEQVLRGLPGLRVLIEFECNSLLISLITFHGKTLERIVLPRDSAQKELPQFLVELDNLNVCSGAYSLGENEVINEELKEVLIETFGDDLVVRSRFCEFQTTDETCDQCLRLIRNRDRHLEREDNFQRDHLHKTLVKNEPDETWDEENDEVWPIPNMQLPPKLRLTRVKLDRLENREEQLWNASNDLSRVIIKAIPNDELQDEVDYGDLNDFDFSPVIDAPRPKRDRPRKNFYTDLDDNNEEPKKKRGRPRKYLVDLPNKVSSTANQTKREIVKNRITYRESSDEEDESQVKNEAKEIKKDDNKETNDDEWSPDNEERLILKRSSKPPILNGQRAFRCDECSELFTTLYFLKKHQRSCLSSELCEQRGLKECPICLFRPTSVSSHNRHVQVHSQKMDLDQPVDCPECGLELSNKRQLNPHFQKEHDKNLGICVKCLKIMPKENLPKHTQLHHYDEAKHLCTLCGVSFVFPFQLRVHMRKHEEKESKREEDPNTTFICDRCGKECKTKLLLKKHVNYVHADGHFPCAQCTKVFTSHERLRRHLVLHNSDKIFFCPYCDYKTKRKDNVQLHSRKMHNKVLAGFQVGGDPRFDPNKVEKLENRCRDIREKNFSTSC